MGKKKEEYFLNLRCKMRLVFSRWSLVSSEEKIKMVASCKLRNKMQNTKMVFSYWFSFLVGIASVVSLLRNDRKKEKYKIQDAGYFF